MLIKLISLILILLILFNPLLAEENKIDSTETKNKLTDYKLDLIGELTESQQNIYDSYKLSIVVNGLKSDNYYDYITDWKKYDIFFGDTKITEKEFLNIITNKNIVGYKITKNTNINPKSCIGNGCLLSGIGMILLGYTEYEDAKQEAKKNIPWNFSGIAEGAALIIIYLGIGSATVGCIILNPFDKNNSFSKTLTYSEAISKIDKYNNELLQKIKDGTFENK